MARVRCSDEPECIDAVQQSLTLNLVDDMMRIGRRTSQEVHLPIYEQN